MANYLSIEKRKQIFHLLVEGNGLRSITRLVGCSKGAVTELQRRYSVIINFINRKYIKDLKMPEIEVDEIRTFIVNKKNLRWIYIALDRVSRMVIHFHTGSRDANDAEIFLSGLSYKLNETSKISTDSLQSYISAINRPNSVYLDRFSTEKLELESARYLGKVLGRGITNRIETHNGNVRQHIAKLGRKTKCFAKKDESLRQHLSLFFFYYNFIKVHSATKTAPAVTAKLIDKKFTMEDLIEYDLMFTGKFQIPKNNYGIVSSKYVNKKMSVEDKSEFLSEVIKTTNGELKNVNFYGTISNEPEGKLRIA